MSVSLRFYQLCFRICFCGLSVACPLSGRWWLVVAWYRDVLSESCQWTGPPTRILSLGSRPGRAEWACLADSMLLSRTGLLKWKLGTFPYVMDPDWQLAS